jgi:hypothetical protein
MARKTHLRCERLDDRIAPSLTPVSVPLPTPIAAPVKVTAAASPIVLPAPTPIIVPPPPVPAPTVVHPVAGFGSGKYICTLQAGNVPTGFHFTGVMDTKGMGRVTVQASIYGVGYRNAPAGGRITLTNGKGSVTIELTALPQPKLSKLPEWFRYRIVQSSGAYKGMTDSGTLRLSRYADLVPVRNGIRYCEAGSFRLII